jgi:hypothetical protein
MGRALTPVPATNRDGRQEMAESNSTGDVDGGVGRADIRLGLGVLCLMGLIPIILGILSGG